MVAGLYPARERDPRGLHAGTSHLGGGKDSGDGTLAAGSLLSRHWPLSRHPGHPVEIKQVSHHKLPSVNR